MEPAEVPNELVVAAVKAIQTAHSNAGGGPKPEFWDEIRIGLAAALSHMASEEQWSCMGATWQDEATIDSSRQSARMARKDMLRMFPDAEFVIKRREVWTYEGPWRVVEEAGDG